MKNKIFYFRKSREHHCDHVLVIYFNCNYLIKKRNIFADKIGWFCLIFLSNLRIWKGSIMVDMLNIVRECNCDNANKMNVKKITTSRS